MSKKIRVILITVAMLIVSTFLLPRVEAHNVELDPDSLITFPWFITNGNGEITIKSSETNYQLYWQAVQVPDATLEKIDKIQNEGKTEKEKLKEEMDNLNKEYKELKEKRDEKYNIYKEKLDSNVEGEELETAKQDYETADTNYKNKVSQYNKKVDEYNSKVKEINEKVKELTPMYNENNWNKTEDDNFQVDLSTFSGKKSFVVWAKLTTSNGKTSYDEAIYSMSGTKSEEKENTEENKVENEVQNEIVNEASNKTNQSTDNTIAKGSLPKTGIKGGIAFTIIAIIVAIVSYKKYDKYKEIK